MSSTKPDDARLNEQTRAAQILGGFALDNARLMNQKAEELEKQAAELRNKAAELARSTEIIGKTLIPKRDASDDKPIE